MNSCMHRTTIQTLLVLLLVAGIVASIQLAYAQTTYDEIPVDVYSSDPEAVDVYSFNYVLEEGTELGWELESDNSSRLFTFIVFNDPEDIFGSELVDISKVNSSFSSVIIPSGGYWYMTIRRALFIDENYTVHVTGKIWQDGTEVPTTYTSTTASTSTTAPTETPTSNPPPLISLTTLIGVVVVIVILIGYHCLRRDWGSGTRTHHNTQYYSKNEWLAIIKVIDSTLGSQGRVIRYKLRDAFLDLITKGDLDVPLTKTEDVVNNSIASGLIVEHEDRTLSLSEDYEDMKKEILPSR